MYFTFKLIFNGVNVPNYIQSKICPRVKSLLGMGKSKLAMLGDYFLIFRPGQSQGNGIFFYPKEL